ncbi:ribonuclease Z, partial [Candidatus Woesearchaeota archaeon]|nr:ribonuclease Z [Candidatus Woesearchaeota archaeon]
MKEITFLGTSCGIPTKERNTFSALLRYYGENILIDCGEATQIQLRKIDISPSKITKILISHLHGDHILGIPGLIQTIRTSNINKEITIYGPKNTKKFMTSLLSLFIPNLKNIKIIEINNGKFFENNDFQLQAEKLNHSIDCLAYSLIEKDKRKINLKFMKKFNLTKSPLLGDLQKGKTINFKGHKITPKQATFIKKGKKITFILDTKLCNSAISISKNSDLLISESTYADEHKGKADEFKHLTSQQAAFIAKKSKSKQLILLHFSQRYKTTDIILKEAKKVFKNTKCVNDLDK